MPETSAQSLSFFAPTVWRRFLAAFTLVALILAAIIALLYLQDLQHQRAILEQEALNVVSLEQEFLRQEFGAIKSDLLYLAQQETLKRFVSGDESARGELEREYSHFAVSKGIYDQIRFIDVAGNEVIRVNYNLAGEAEVVPADELQVKAMRYYFQQSLTLESGEILVSPFDLNVEYGELERPIKPMVRFLTPVFQKESEKRGFMVINYLGVHLLRKLKEISLGFRGDTMLLNLSGEYLRASEDEYEWGWMLNHSHNFRKHYPEAWREFRSKGEGQFRVGGDLFTFRLVSPAAAAESGAEGPVVRQDANALLLVSHVPHAVATARSSQLLRQLLMLFAGTQVLVAVLALYWARSSAIRRSQEHRLAESESRLRRLSSRLLTAQETERRNLSRMLHDELGQQVTAINLDLKSAIRQENGQAARPLVERAIEETQGLLQSIHQLATTVRPTVLDDIGLPEAMESYVSEYERRTGIEVDCHLQFHKARIPPTVGENVYRIFQESLANVASHAQTKYVAVEVDVQDRVLRMCVQDPGVGFSTDEIKDSSRLGILGMRERVELLNGDFELISAPGAGTKVQVAIPLQSPENEHSRPAACP